MITNLAKNILGNDSYVYHGYDKNVTAPRFVTHAVIASHVATIHADAFKRCTWLTTINIPNTVNEIGEKAFKGCTGLKTIKFQADSSLRKLGPKVFKDCTSLTSIAIPYGIRVIPDKAFHGCSSLTSVHVTETVVEISRSAFKDCTSLNSFRILHGTRVIPDKFFHGLSFLTSVHIPDTVDEIGKLAFKDCTSLTSITIPHGTRVISYAAFLGCSSLTSVHVPDTVDEIGRAAFRDCTSLSSFRIPHGIRVIPDEAFHGCSSLTSVHVPDTVDEIGRAAFRDCTSLISFRIPHGIRVIPDKAFHGCSSLTSVHVTETVVEISRSAFKDCTSLILFRIPHGFRVIPDEFFYGFSSLTYVYIPDTVVEIGKLAFKNCTSLTSIRIPHGTRVIPNEAFKRCSSLTSVYIPDTVVEIGKLAFKGCKSLTRLQIPKSVTKIGYEAFLGCDGLCSMTKLPPNVQNFPDCLFSGLPQNIYIQSGPGPRYGFKGKTQYGYGPEMCGITLQQLEDLKNHPSITDNTTMREVAEKVIKPATKDCGMGYSLLINQKKPLHAQVMVSHAWDETFYAFVTCLRRSGHKGPFWICTFAIYQNQGDHDHPTVGEQLGSDPEYGPFATVLKAAKLMMAVITDTCDIYTRLWCVFELHIAQTLNVPVELRPFISKDDERDGKLEKDACVSRLGTAVDCASAYVSMKSDRRSIHEAITRDSANGFDTVNQAVEMIRLEYLLNYPIANIMGGKKWSDDKEFFYVGTLILILLFLFLLILVFWGLAVDSVHLASGGILGIHSYLPIIGVLVLFVLRLFTTELELATFIMAFVFGIIMIVLWHILAYLAKSRFFWIGLITFIGFLTTYTVPNRIQLLLDHDSRENRKEAAASLAKAVETLYPRALGDANSRIMISFDNFRESNVFRLILCNCFPLLMYRRWSTMIMRQKKRNNRNNREEVKSSTIPAPPGIDNYNETTPLVVV